MALTATMAAQLAVPHGAAAADALRFGVVTVDRNIACLRGFAPPAGERIMLVDPDTPQRAYEARVAHVSRCEPVSGAPAVELAWGEAAGHVAPLIGIAGAAGKAETRRGQVVVAGPGQRAGVRFRSCASADGLHLTAWRGAPTRSVRVWHAYVYLNQDLEADCTASDVR